MPERVTHHISDQQLTLEDLHNVCYNEVKLELSAASRQKIVRCREYLDKKLQNTNSPLYGINTGFGSLYNKNISSDQLEKLQENLVKSHACGIGSEIPEEIVRLMLFLKVKCLAHGYSAAQLVTVERLIEMFNHSVFPRIYEAGSLGASGDLAPLAHLALTLIAEGEVRHEGKILPGKEISEKLNWTPIQFKAKEGLALLNGTEFMNAYGVWAVLNSHRLLKIANILGALSLDAFDGRTEPFLPIINNIRPQKGQMAVAQSMLELLNGSELAAQPKEHIQDPYSFRCIPQVHGASKDAIDYVTDVVLAEVNSVTDNPSIFPEEDAIISAGNFHGQPLALAFDFLAIALSELGSISERRTFQLISGSRGLPNYLVTDPGIHSGLMIPQYSAAALVSQNKQLCTPASVDSIVSSNGQEDHVSMGANAATKLYRVVNNLYSILAIELLTAVQALEFRRPLKTSPYLEGLRDNFRKVVPFINEDQVLHGYMKNSEEFLKNTDCIQ